MKKILLTFLSFFPLFAYGEAYTIEIEKRSDSNLYITTRYPQKLLIKTKYCYEYVYHEQAVLFYDKYSYDNKIVFKSGASCEVEDVYVLK